MASQKPKGRPTKLTPKVQATICRLLRAGNYLETAAAGAGVDYRTVRRWIERGETEEDGEFCQFCQAIKKAISDSEKSDLAKIERASKTRWVAAAWRLERRFPERWGALRQGRVEFDRLMGVFLELCRERLAPEVYQQVAPLYVEAVEGRAPGGPGDGKE